MAVLRLGLADTAPAPIPTSYLDDFDVGDDVEVRRVVEGLPAGAVLTEAWLTVKTTLAAADPGTLQKRVTAVASADGQITDQGGGGVGGFRILLTGAETTALGGSEYVYDLQVGLADGTTCTIERGYLQARRAWPELARVQRFSAGRIRAVHAEGPAGHRAPRRNELLELVAGDTHTLSRTIEGVPAGDTIASATLTIRSSPLQADPGLVQKSITLVGSASGQVTDAGASGIGALTVKLAPADTALLTTVATWDLRVTLASGTTYTVLRGTLLPVFGVTSAVASAAAVILRYVPGDSLAALGATFSRSSTATYIDAAGVVQTAASGVLRDAHYIGGVRHALLEGARTNVFNGISTYSPAQATATPNAAAAPDGTATALRLTDNATASNHGYFLPFTAADNTDVVLSIFAKAETLNYFGTRATLRSGVNQPGAWNLATGAAVAGTWSGFTVRRIALANGWCRLEIRWNVGAGATAPVVGVLCNDGVNLSGYTGTGKSLLLWGLQLEVGVFQASSYIPTVASPATRAADALSFPFTTPPSALTAYVDLTDVGAIIDAGGSSNGVLRVGSGNDWWGLYGAPASNQDFLRAGYSKAGAIVATQIAKATVLDQRVEYATQLLASGAVYQARSVAAGAIVEATSAPVAGGLGAAFDAPLTLQLGDGSRPWAVRALKVAAGGYTLPEMRGA